jgi:hypothetical protein
LATVFLSTDGQHEFAAELVIPAAPPAEPRLQTPTLRRRPTATVNWSPGTTHLALPRNGKCFCGSDENCYDVPSAGSIQERRVA